MGCAIGRLWLLRIVGCTHHHDALGELGRDTSKDSSPIEIPHALAAVLRLLVLQHVLFSHDGNGRIQEFALSITKDAILRVEVGKFFDNVEP